MSRWLIVSEEKKLSLQDMLNDFNPVEYGSKDWNQPDLWDNRYEEHSKEVTEIPKKQLKIYNKLNFNWLTDDRNWLNNNQIVDKMNFNYVLAQKLLNLKEDKYKALEQVVEFLKSHIQFNDYDIIKIEIDNDVFYIIGHKSAGKVELEIFEDAIKAAGKLNFYAIKFKNGKKR